MTPSFTRTFRVVHAIYGSGWFSHVLETPGHARVQFDIDGDIERRVLVRDLAPERDRGRLIEDREVCS